MKKGEVAAFQKGKVMTLLWKDKMYAVCSVTKEGN